jgi:autotransporter-associated beta strand protein
VSALNGGTLNLGTTVLTVAAGNTLGTITGATGSLVKSGADTLTLGAATSFGGTTTVNGGTIVGAVSGALGSTSAIAVNGALLNVVDYNNAAALSVDASGFATISGTGLSLSAVSNLNTTANSVYFTGVTGTTTLASLSGAGNTRFASNATITGGISLGTVNVAGLLTSDISGGVVNANALSSASVSGGITGVTNAATVTTVSGGATTVGGIATLGTVSGGVLNLNGATSNVSALNGGTLNLGTTVLTVAAGNTLGTITGANGSLVKSGADTLTFGAATSFGGSLTVSGGTLVAG